MRRRALLKGAWLLAAPRAFSQTPLAASELLRYTLQETPEQLQRVLGRPVLVSEASPGYVTWYYQTDVKDQHDHSHLLMFRKSDNALVSVTRNFHTAVTVDALFPERLARTYYWPSNEDRQWSVRVRPLGTEALAIAMGVRRAGETTTQVVLIRRSALPQFLPWLADQLAPALKANGTR